MNNKIKYELNEIEIPPELHNRSIQGVKMAKAEVVKRPFSRISIIPIVASILLIFSVSVTAATSSGFNNLISIVSPKLADFLLPINTSVTDNDIKMEVIAAMSDDDMAVIYLTMEDLSNNRIDETIDLYDYSLSGGKMFTSELIDYDENLNKATIRLQANGVENTQQTKLNLTIHSFLSHKQTFEQVEVDFKKFISYTPETITLDMINNTSGGGGTLYEILKEQGIIQVLKPKETEISLPGIDFMHITNIGIIANRLHIQVKWREGNIDDHGFFYLTGRSGERIDVSNVSFDLDNQYETAYGNDFTEYIFDIKGIELNNYQLMGDFYQSDEYTNGNWETTFKLNSNLKERTFAFKKDFGTWKTTALTVSPLGITLKGKGSFDEDSALTVEVKMKNGTIETLDSVISFSDKNEVKAKILPSLPLDVPKIDAIIVNGSAIQF